MPGRDGYLRLIHWKEEEVVERVDRLEALGYEVDGTVPGTSLGIKALSADPPIAVVVDLGRLPSHGREMARSVRQSKKLRTIPIVFVGGAPDKVAQAEDEFPDAAFAEWDDVGPVLEGAIADPPVDPIVPVSDSGPRSGKPLHAKLGVKPGAEVVLLGAPQGAEALLGELPEGATVRRARSKAGPFSLWFVTESAVLEKRLPAIAEGVGEGTLWIAWPKGSANVDTELTELTVQRAGLALGLVDTKVCAIDDTWSGLRFTRRRS